MVSWLVIVNYSGLEALSSLHNKGSWQCIILDHAASDIYGDIEDVYEVDEW